MSSYNSKDMNNLLANLNSVEPLDYASTSSSQQPADLSIFANTEFFDFDAGRNTDLSVDEMLMNQEKHLQEKRARCEGTSGNNNNSNTNSSSIPEFSSLDFNSLNEFSLAQGLPNPPSYHQAAPPSHSATTHNTPGAAPPQHFNFNAPPVAPANTPVSIDGGALSTTITTGPEPKKRKTSRASSNDGSSPAAAAAVNGTDDATGARVAAEEDKRRRNTAASARFRIKKKQREQEMERNTKELQDKVQGLESKVMQLEMENKWLRNLVVEKNEARDVSSLLDMKNKVLADTKSSLGVKSEESK